MSLLSTANSRSGNNGGKSTAYCYVADGNFILGSLLSILSIKKNCLSSNGRFFLFILSEKPLDDEKFMIYALKNSIEIVFLDTSLYSHAALKDWNATHVPTSALGRLFIESYLPDEIKRIVYIDGDTYFNANAGNLLEYCPPDGYLAAAEDSNYFIQFDNDKYGEKVRSYFKGIGIERNTGYFNSGIMIANRQDWREISNNAFQFFVNNAERCLYHDQSALNAVSADRRVRLSPRWNFQTPFKYWGIEQAISPGVLHFTEFPKPWMTKVYPWRKEATDLGEFADQLDYLSLARNELSVAEQRRLNKQNVLRMLRINTIFRKKLYSRRRVLSQLISSSEI